MKKEFCHFNVNATETLKNLPTAINSTETG